MRIADLCLACFFIDDFGYQENILPRAHRRMGHEVIIVASTETYIDKTTIGYVKPSSYLNNDGIEVHRLPYARWVPRALQRKVRAYEGAINHLEAFQPDIIFLHDLQFWDIVSVCRYAAARGITVHADSHTDYINSARTLLSRHILHGIFYRFLVRRADRFIHRYLPTLPARATFLREVYGLSGDKMELLPFGCDDIAVAELDREAIREEMRLSLGIDRKDLILVTGGKLDMRKCIHLLIDVFSKLRSDGELPNVHLVVFGEMTGAVGEALKSIAVDSHVHMLGWVPSGEIFRIFWAADVALFPGTHSVLWEEAVGHGLGAVFRRWDGMEHLDLGGNAVFIEDASTGTLEIMLRDLAEDGASLARSLSEVARQEGPKVFSFNEIARRAIA